MRVERFGITPDGQPVTEERTYVPARPEHPLALTVDGHDGHWVLSSISNDLGRVNAREVTRIEYNAATSAWEQKVAQAESRLAADREARAASAEQVRQAARVELLGLGLSSGTVELLVGRR